MNLRIIIPIVLFAGGLFFLQSRQSSHKAQDYTSESKAEEPRAIAPSPKNSTEGISVMRHKVALHGQMMAAGIRQSSFRSDKAQQLTVTFTQRRQWCVIGDLDTIRMQTQSVSAKEWQLSLEQKNRVKSVDVTLQDLMEGRSISLSFPADEGIFGLYLCKKNKRKSCSQERVWNTHQQETSNADSLLVNVQPLVRKDQKIYALPTHQWDRAIVKKLKSLLIRQNIPVGDSLDQIFEKVALLRPFGASFDENGVIVPLGINDPNCLL